MPARPTYTTAHIDLRRTSAFASPSRSYCATSWLVAVTLSLAVWGGIILWAVAL
jgi:hypothetical protein